MLAGKVAIIQGAEDAEQLIAVHGPRRFLGELSLLIGQPAFYTAKVVEPGSVLRVPVEHVRERVGEDPAFGDLVLRAFVQRRSILIGLGAGLQIVGSCYSADTRRLLEFVARNRLPHRWLDLEEDPEAERLLDRLGVPPQDTPIVLSAASCCATRATPSSRARCTSRTPAPRRELYDLVVVGAGPAGLAAAVYGASEGLDDDRARRGGRRRPGGDVVADRELPRLPLRPLRRRARRAGAPPGPEVRRDASTSRPR